MVVKVTLPVSSLLMCKSRKKVSLKTSITSSILVKFQICSLQMKKQIFVNWSDQQLNLKIDVPMELQLNCSPSLSKDAARSCILFYVSPQLVNHLEVELETSHHWLIVQPSIGSQSGPRMHLRVWLRDSWLKSIWKIM